jgi:hypothetical protein
MVLSARAGVDPQPMLEKLDTPLPLISLTAQTVRVALATVLGEEDFSPIINVLERLSREWS